MADTRVVKHAMGETRVPARPQRVVVLGDLDNVLALGVTPVAATHSLDGFLPYLRQRTEGIASLGINGEPNLESLVRLKPDLILGSVWDKELYDRLSQIAPTVLADGEYAWKDWLRTYAEALGKTAVAQQLLKDYEQRLETFRQQMGVELATTEVSLVNFWESHARIYVNRSFSGQILQDIGLPRPPAQDQDKMHINVSLELIPQMEGDVIFLMLGSHNASKLDQFRRHPLWSQLRAVQQNRVYEVSSDTWISGWGILAAHRVLDDLSQYLLPTQKSQPR